MADGVAEVEGGAQPGGFKFVLLDDSGFVWDAAGDYLLKPVVLRLYRASPQLFGESSVHDQSRFADLGHTVSELAEVEGRQRLHIYDHGGWRVECADEILAF